MKIIELEAYEKIPEYAGFENDFNSIEIKDDCVWEGHAYGICVGMIKKNGTVISYFKTDKKNRTTEIFDKLRKDIQLLVKHTNFINENEEMESGVRYFIPYKVKNHSSTKPTVTECYVDSCNNVHYFVEYEILLVAGEGFKKYITEKYETEGSFSACFYDQVKNIENMFEEWFEEGLHGFKINEFEEKTVTFYDDTGEDCDIEILSIDELLSMISSIRVIKCENEIIK